MDQDLREYLEAFRAENSKRFDELGQRIDGTNQEVRSLREETTQRFDGMNQEVRSLREETTQLREGTALRFDETAHRFDKLETDVQGVYIRVEHLEGVIQLVAEGVTTVTHQLKRQGEEISERFDTVESFNRLIYKDLDSRVKK